MALKWNPETDPVHKNEAIGRRLFDEPMLMGAGQQPNYQGLLVTHFEETRDDRQLSLDRLGATGPASAVKRYLVPRAELAAAKFRSPKKFNGWAVVSAKFLEQGVATQKFPVLASPIPGTGYDANIYHAHTDLPAGIAAMTCALHLRHIFTSKGTIEQLHESSAPKSNSKWTLKIGTIWNTIRHACSVFFRQRE